MSTETIEYISLISYGIVEILHNVFFLHIAVSFILIFQLLPSKQPSLQFML